MVWAVRRATWTLYSLRTRSTVTAGTAVSSWVRLAIYEPETLARPVFRQRTVGG